MAVTQNNLPVHVAVIMDGNGRWAQNKSLRRAEGHRAGTIALREIIKHCCSVGIKYLTVYAFSTENFKRPADEVGALMALFKEFFIKDIKNIIDLGVKIRIIGDISLLPGDVAQMALKSVASTEKCDKMVFTVAIAYGARREIANAVKAVAKDAVEGKLTVSDIDEQYISDKLQTGGLPDPDLLIRTGGELRLSNFLLYQTAYSELYFTDVYWPDFTPEEFDKALASYANRQRRYGGLK